jgi:hypothetical protein
LGETRSETLKCVPHQNRHNALGMFSSKRLAMLVRNDSHEQFEALYQTRQLVSSAQITTIG